MTIEELKAEAKALGYTVVKTKPQEKLLPCICGCRYRERWSGTHDHSVIIKCHKCGREASGRTEREARHNWNEMVRGCNQGIERETRQ